MPRIGSRRWIAWKLVQFACRIYDTEHWDRLTVHTPGGDRVVEWLVCGDAYGCGVFSQDTHGTPGGYVVDWQEIEPDWRES